MRIPIDRESPLPIYRQIVAFLRSAIESGGLAEGVKLPSTRQLAADLGINRITAANAYAELEADGLIYNLQGSGAYVAQPFLPPAGRAAAILPEEDWPLWQRALPPPPNSPLHSLEEHIRACTCGRSGLIPLHLGIPDPGLFPVDEFRKVLQAVIRRDGMDAFEYGDLAGYLPLRKTIAHVLGQEGIPTRAEEVLVTSGSQQAINLVIRALLQPGDTVLVESPTYSGALDLFRAAGLKIIGVPVDERGMQLEAVPALIQAHNPKLIYTIPNFQNPTGVCLSGRRRRDMLALAAQASIPILEDDFVGDLRYEGRSLPALKALDPGGQVIYISTFSKMLAPGLRVGYILANGPVFETLLAHKRVADLATSSLIQRTLESYITVGRYQAHLRRACQVYRRRRNAMLTALQTFLPEDTQFSTPHGGLFFWLQLPKGCSSLELLQPACREGVAFLPGTFCYPNEGGEKYLRLTFAAASPEQIESGIQRLSICIRRECVVSK
ncbi:MAG: PLP-dependent aminotransferase family protein [Anaerolineaceae bacterium]|nr:PLP-dependent aminotransferase family protein [Anaerolineaceae bacterium]